MRKQRPLQLIFAARLYGGSSDEICARGEALLEGLAATPGDQPPPMHWNFAAASVLESPSRRLHNLILEIKTRQATRGDSILPAGFTGAVHTRLLDEELKRELTWCFKNPWFSALGAVFGLAPAAVLPFRADPLREAAAGAYSAAGYRLLALPVALGAGLPGPRSRRGVPGATPAGLSALGRLWSLGAGRATLLPAVVIRCAAEAALLLRLAAALGGQDARLLILLDPQTAGTGADAPELLRLLVGGLRQSHGVSFPSLTELCSAAPPDGLPPLSRFALAAEEASGEPVRTVQAGAASPRTSRRRSNAELRCLLEASRALPAPGSTRAGRPEARAVTRLHEGAAAARRHRAEIVMSASMTGLVTLAGSRYDATFADGRLSGFAAGGRQILGGGSARSYLRLGAEAVALQTESAFSFERDTERGVHTELTAALGPAASLVRLHMDSFFRDGEEPLTIEMSLELSHPADASRFTALVPLELPLSAPAGAGLPRLEAELPGGGLYREALATAEGLLYGRRVRIALGDAALIIESPAAAGSGVVSVQFRVKKSRKPLLLVNLGGTYALTAGCSTALLTGPISFRVGLAPARSSESA